ncbi:MAG: nickel-dependent hydrogenase large subunit [bacterium]|nr:nickel-dependent hydrogenase large subunit [bacterium]
MEEFTVPIGPQHPALKEPISLRMTFDGEVVKHVDVRLGYNHRGMEKMAEERSYIQNLYLTERICGICSHSHTTCFAQGVEKLMEIEPPKRGLYIRTLVAEIERVHSHLLWLGVAGHEAGFDTFFMYTWRDREIVMDILESISGNRVHYAINTFGGVRRDISEAQKQTILDSLGLLKQRTEYYTNIGTTEPTFVARIKGVGKLSKELALSLCAVGPTVRASGIKSDVRKDDPYAVYNEIPFEVCTADTGDVFGRVVVRVNELFECYKMIEFMLKNLPVGDIVVKAPRRVKENEVVSRYEAPRGENLHYIKSNGTDKPERLKVRAPTLANYPATVEMLKGCFIADIPLIFAAIDPCICCAERMVELVNVKNGEASVVSFGDLKKLASEQYKKCGNKPEPVSIAKQLEKIRRKS